MGRNASSTIVLATLAIGAAGCNSTPVARYVYQDGQYGVIGIPINSPLGRINYLEEAEMLMTRHFPEGYEIVRSEEVVEGERILDTAIKKELQSEPGLTALNQALKIGKFARSSSLDQKDTLHITESRIIYKRKVPGQPSEVAGFANSSAVRPEFYIDPNDLPRLEAKDLLLAGKKGEKDRKLMTASASKPADKAKPADQAKPDAEAAEKPLVAETLFKDDKLQQVSGEKPN